MEEKVMKNIAKIMILLLISQKAYSFDAPTPNPGPNQQNVLSFQRGINSQIAQGHGQGAGFYVFLNKNKAIQHATQFLESDGTNGYPMVVTMQAVFSPQNFSLDAEVMTNLVGPFIFNTWNGIIHQKMMDETCCKA